MRARPLAARFARDRAAGLRSELRVRRSVQPRHLPVACRLAGLQHLQEEAVAVHLALRRAGSGQQADPSVAASCSAWPQAQGALPEADRYAA